MSEAFSASVSPVRVSFSFATPPISPACSSVTGVNGLAEQRADVRQTFGSAGARVHQVRVVLEHAGDHFEIRDASRERIGDGFENERGNRLGILHRALDFLAVERALPGSALGRAGEILDRRSSGSGRSPTLCSPEAHSTGKMRIWRTASRRPSRMCSTGQRALVEELFEQRVVALGHHLDQRFVRRSARPRPGRGDVAFLALAVAVQRIGVRFHAHQVDHAFEVALRADGQMNREPRCGRRRIARFRERARSWIVRGRAY